MEEEKECKAGTPPYHLGYRLSGLERLMLTGLLVGVVSSMIYAHNAGRDPSEGRSNWDVPSLSATIVGYGVGLGATYRVGRRSRRVK